MRKILNASLVLAFSFPFVAAAYDVSLVSGIVNVNVATSSTGGVTVSSGSSVTGDSSASANIRNIINSRGGASSVTVEVETESDGVVSKEFIHENIEGVESVKISVTTADNDSGARSEMTIETEEVSFGTTSPRSFFSWINKFFSFDSIKDEDISMTDEKSESVSEEDVDARSLATIFQFFSNKIWGLW